MRASASSRRARGARWSGSCLRGARVGARRERPMLKVETPKDLLQHIGRELGPSDWITVDQAMIDRFADATGDHQWIHVDVERARREMPGGKTIAHGYLTLSLIPRRSEEHTSELQSHSDLV